MNILFIEDDHEFSKILKLFFEQTLKATVLVTDKPKQISFIMEDFNPDIILLDLFLGNTSGLTILKEIRKNPFYKKIPIIILTGDKDKKSIALALKLGANDYIIKPPKTELLIQRINKLYEEYKNDSKNQNKLSKKEKTSEISPENDFNRLLVSATQKLARMLSSEELQIPALPKIALEVQNRLKDPQVGSKEIADMIKQDLAISSKVLKISNSSYYCASNKITDVNQAVTRIGIKEIKTIVQLISGNQLFKTKNPEFNEIMQKLWEHSLACAYSNQLVAKKLNLMDTEYYFMLGLTHDVGKVFLFNLISKALEESRKYVYVFTEEVNNKLIKSMHNQLGENMMIKWNYSKEFIEVAKDHNSKLEKISKLKHVLITYFSNLLTRKIEYSLYPYDEESVANLSEAASLLQLENNQIDEIEISLKDIVSKIKENFK